MATPTYTLIEEQVLGSSASSVTFSSIPQTPYKDLVFEVVFANSAGGDAVRMQYNGESYPQYFSNTDLTGNGTSATSGRESNQTSTRVFGSSIGPTTTISTGRIEILSYANTSVYKTDLSRYSDKNGDVSAIVGLWRSTAAISSVRLFNIVGSSFVTGSTFRLWGIA